MPIKNSENETIAVVQLFNKLPRETPPPEAFSKTIEGFNVKDIRVSILLNKKKLQCFKINFTPVFLAGEFLLVILCHLDRKLSND
jgi:hypothetical protein